MRALFLIGILATMVYGQVSVDIHIGDRRSPPPPPVQEEVVYVPQGFEEECEYRTDLVVISPDVIGFWIRLPSGRFVLQCRTVFYDSKHDRMYYGPWRRDDRVRYHHKYARYDDYVVQHYPRYKWHHRPQYIREDKCKDKHHQQKHDHDRGEHRGHGR